MPHSTGRAQYEAPRSVAPAALLVAALACVVSTLPAARVIADESLHERIDRLIEADQVIPLAPLANDAEFLRRVTLDLVGRVPSVSEVRAFAADASPEKRSVLVDRLLASPEYARHITNVFDVMLMERRPEKNVPIAEWQKYLYESFAANKPYDQLVREILSADGVDPAARAQARFYLDREGEPNLLTRDVGRIFLGMDLQCAQCHDHPLIADYYQADYQGLYAFFNRSILFTDKDKKVFLAEKADGDVAYVSVFDATRKGTALPQLPAGEPVPEPSFNKGEEYTVAPADNVRPVPKYSRRAQLPEQLTAKRNPHFDRTIANRLWALLLGRGLVDPVDLDHEGNAPSHPAALALLAESLPAMKYDLRAMLAELARTRTYARSIDLAAELPAQAQTLEPQLSAWEADRAARAAVYEASQDKAGKIGVEFAAARTAAAPVADELAKSRTTAAEAKKNAEAAVATFTAAQNSLPARQEAAALVGEANAKTAAAAQKLADDKELADAAAKLKARSEHLATEVVTLTKAVADGPAAVKATSEALAAADQTLAATTEKFAPLQARVTELTVQAKMADNQSRADSATLTTIVSKIDDAKAVVDLARSQTTVEAARASVVKADADVATARQAIANHQGEIDRANQALAGAQQAATAANSATEDARKQKSDRQATYDAVAEAAAKTQIAQQKLPDSAELALAAQSLQGKANELAAGLKMADAQVAEREAVGKTMVDQLTAAQSAVTATAEARAKLVEQAQPFELASATAKQQLDAELGTVDTARRKVIDRSGARCAVAVLKPLTPEQLAWSMLQASGVADRERAAVEAEWNKNHPTPDDAAQAARPRDLDRALSDKLKGSVQSFVARFAAGPGQPQQAFQATVDQALFLANGGEVRSWLAPVEGSLTDRVVKLANPQEATAELYLTVLSRAPTDQETAAVATYLAGRDADRAAAVGELAWALFCSAEFRFNH
ncbi:MAG TPA: DUF1549 domain-containing protein [Pirellulales bacterium]|jgi:hypothetical protein